MNRKMLVAIVVMGAVAVASAVLPLALAQAGQGAGHSEHMSGMHTQPAKTDVLSLESIHSEYVPMVLMSIDKARKALETGDRRMVLAELDKAQQTLETIHAALGKHVKPQFVNNLCPIMGSPINPATVTKNLIRDYKGQKVAFCCAGCPATWDKLTDAQKQVKLAAAKSDPSQLYPSHKH